MTHEIGIDEEVWALLREQAEPFTDTPNSVLRRLLGLPALANGSDGDASAAVAQAVGSGTARSRAGRRRAKRVRFPRAQTGTILDESEYELPILKILDELGGRAPTSEVIDALGERLGDKLMPADHQELASGDVRWRNRAQFVRLRLVERGDMKRGSPRGIWEITEQGRDRLVAS